MTDSLPDYDALNEALAEVDAEIGAAEAHGLLAGMLSASAQVEAAQWIAQVLAGTEPKGDPARRCLEGLATLYGATQQGMDDSNLEFQLMLPDGSAPVDRRAESLGGWAHGFIYGLGVGGLPEESKLPKEVAEIIGHLGEVSHAVSDEGGEADEAAYEELLEFVRTGALLVREHLQPRKRDKPVPVPGADQGSQRTH
ncbi:UPF0149 family protein [Aquisalimonas asiatica]|uniref:YecA family protein n=1 Tax=Aquisalimonas asiatica TaxID=406100 RepID=A0A1H8VKF9_9GAMM|nr:UPF0149 family protein [Aquisalimonas asiatica]SEP15823.1 hypothetical protein SAMN04488052_11329 [Aquisalimonas asiatica]